MSVPESIPLSRGLSVTALLRSQHTVVLDRLLSRILEDVPHYTLLDPLELRHNVASLFEEMLKLAEQNLGHGDGLQQAIQHLTQRRVHQGITLAEYLQAILSAIPVLREVIREQGYRQDPALAEGYGQFEALLYQLVQAAANAYIQETARRFEAKNQELNRINQQLRLQEQLQSVQLEQTSEALDLANQFNQRVLESLAAGIMVVDSQSLAVRLYSSRMEEILGIPSEEVLGRSVLTACQEVQGLDVAYLVNTVQLLGRLPLTKIHLTLGNGRPRSVHIRAQRMYHPNGEPEATVVVVDDVTERELLVDSFSRYVSRSLVQQLLTRATPLGLEGERRHCTILFADIRGFTQLSEQNTPEDLHELLNTYFRVMIDCIVAQGGFIDKFIGDKVMAIFSSASDPAVDAEGAVQAALDIKAQLHSLNQRRMTHHLQPIEVGIGINTGDVLLGNVGSETRMEFTAIGDVVNVADRLQDLARQGEILLGPLTTGHVKDRFPLEPLGPKSVKGRRGEIEVAALRYSPPNTTPTLRHTPSQ